MSNTIISRQVTLIVQQYYTWQEDLEELLGILDPPMTENKVLLCWDQIFYIPESAIYYREDVELDYESRIRGHVIPLEQNDNRIPTPKGYYTRRIIEDPYDKKRISQLYYSYLIRRELELKLWGREYFENQDITTSTRCISVLIQMFINGFGVYRNSYRSLIGFYTILARFTVWEKNRQANVFPITLSPHGS